MSPPPQDATNRADHTAPALETLHSLIASLHERWPDATYQLRGQTPLQLLVATNLAAQCPDTRVKEQSDETTFR